MQLVEPAHLLLGRVRDDHRGEDPAERRAPAAPSPTLIIWSNVSSSSDSSGVWSPGRVGVAAVEEQPGDPLGVRAPRTRSRPVRPAPSPSARTASNPASSTTASRSASRSSSEKSVTSQSERPWPRSSNRMTVANLPSSARKCRQTGLSQSYWRWLSQHVEMTQRRPGAVDGVRDPDAVGGPAEPDLLRRRGGATRRRHVVDATPRPSPDRGGRARSEGHRAGRGDRRPHRL